MQFLNYFLYMKNTLSWIIQNNNKSWDMKDEQDDTG